MSTPVPSALQIAGLGLQIGGATILKDVDLDVAAGSLVGVIGPNGAGKTTLFNVISGLMKPTSGRVLMNGDDITDGVRARAGAGGTGAHLPDLEPLPEAQRARERAARRAGLARRRLLAAALPPANGCRHRAGPREARGRRAQPQARHRGRRHLARRQAQARDRGAAGDRMRASCCSTSRWPGVGSGDVAGPRRQHPRHAARERLHRADGRAPHRRAHGPRRQGRRHVLRQHHRLRHPAERSWTTRSCRAPTSERRA